MEREILLSGMGGQGVQLAAKTLATAAMNAGRRVLMFGTYGGAMRGGDTDATVVIGRDSLFTPPVIDEAWAAIAMHPLGWAGVREKLRPGGLVLLNTSVFDGPVDYDGLVVPLAATGIVSLEELSAVCEEVLPPYRRQFAETNRQALALGHRAVAADTCLAWPRLEVAA